MIEQFKKFLVDTNAFALAIGVVIGGAVSKLVTALVSDIMMPLIGMILPGGAWREFKIPLGTAAPGSTGNALLIGDVLGTAVDFLIIAFVVYVVVAKLFKIAPTK